MLSIETSNAILYMAFILLTGYITINDFDKKYNAEKVFDVSVLILEFICIPMEFFNVYITTVLYALILLITVINIALHREDE